MTQTILADPAASATTLHDHHRAELHASGIPDSLIEAAGIRSVANAEVRDTLGWQPKSHDWGRGWAVPFLDADGETNGYAQVKLDHPRANDKGKTLKYESPVKKPHRAYVPPGFRKLTRGETLLVTEGVKKALSATEAGFPCIALSGVWGWQQKRLRDDTGKAYGKRRLILDLDGINWKGVNVYIVFDSDAVDNDLIRLAEARLAEILKGRGAEVKIVRLPKLADDGKTGLDDFLVHHGERGGDELRRLMAEAEEAETPEKLGPMDSARILIIEEFTGSHGETLAYHREEFWKYTGTQYERVETAELRPRVLAWLDDRHPRPTPKLAADVVKCMEAITVQAFRRDPPFWIHVSSDLPDPRNVIAFSNGLLDVSDPNNLGMSDHTPELFSTSSLPFPYDPKATCSEWERFLRSSLDGDNDRIQLLQKFMGLSLVDDTSYQKLLLMPGPTRAGKGTVARAWRNVLGESVCASPTLSSLAADFGLHPLVNKRLAFIADAHLSRRTDAPKILEALKSVVGEDPQDIQRKYMATLSNIHLPTRFVIIVNELPHFHDPSGALLARTCLLPFERSFAGREDAGLGEKLKAEASGILNWMLTGLRMLREEGFHIPTASRDLLADFRRFLSPIAAFVEDACIIRDGATVPVGDLFAEWRSWCESNGHKSGGKSTFGERLRDVDSRIKRTRPRDEVRGRAYVYENVMLRDDSEC
jgi:putative DNA primase/helicase